MEITRDSICEIWSGIIKEKVSQGNSPNQCLYDIHDLGFVISQLIEPTIAIIVQCATLYICIKNGKDTKNYNESQIGKNKRLIKEVLENYNIDSENVDEIVDSVIDKLGGKSQ